MSPIRYHPPADNTTPTQITWRLESRKSFALSKLLTRNNEIDRRKKNTMPYIDILPTHFKASYQVGVQMAGCGI